MAARKLNTPKRLVPARVRTRMTPGEMLQTVRKLQEMSQAALAAASGVPQPAISAIESGRQELGAERARRLALALRIHPAVLLFPDWEPSVTETVARSG
jgi:transcriptional regulator with XRE-family HTH domain